MKLRALRSTGLLAGLLLVAACSDEMPTSTNPDLIPVRAETFEVTLTFDEFGTDARVDGGYGSPSDVGTPRLVLSEDESLEIRPMLRFAAAPAAISVFPPGESQTVPDSAATPVGGRVTVEFDTLRMEGLPPYEIRAATPTRPWDQATVSWTHAVDTLGGAVPWSEPGGDTRPLETVEWDPTEGSSLVFELDSLTASQWSDAQDLSRGLLLATSTPGARLRVASAALELDLLSSVNPDTVVQVNAPLTQSTMILSAQPSHADGRMLVGGAPSFRSTFRIELPDSVTASGGVCEGAPTCRVALSSDRIIFAGLGFRTIPSEPPAMAPTDSLVLDVRPVLAPERLPRSPLGVTILPQGRILAPDLFLEGGEELIEIPATRIIRDLAAARPDDDDPPPSTLSLISASEPSGIGVASFGRIGTSNAPVLRLILTASEGVTLP